MITGIYTTMSNEQQLCDMSYHFVMEIASDEKLGGGGNNDLMAQAYEGFMYSDPNMLSHNWETTYEGIHRANFAIEMLPGMDETILPPARNNQYLGEYDYIQDYMNETGKDLLYASDNGARNPESLFALKFSNFADWDIRRGYANMYQLFFGLRGLQPVQNTWPFAGGWGQGNSIPKQMVDDWLADEPGDLRLGASVLDIEAELYWEEEVKQEDGSFQTEVRQYAKAQWDFVWESNYWGKKYLGAAYREKEGDKFIYYNDYSVKMYGNPDNNQLSHADDLIFIRYADVLLMLAELNEDVQYINAVRERSGLAEVSAYSLEVLQKERRYELAFEGLRWNDMRRWGADYCKAALESQVGAPVLNFGTPATFNGVHPDGYSARYEETKGFYPIPQAQIDLSDGLLEQVAGYRDGKGLYPGFSQ